LRRANAELAATAAREQLARESAEAALLEAERAAQAKADFLAAVSHELRTP
ncbi:MAG TPA: PAS domain-containing sensor histidine kinase, partial [Acidobacteria bacterium]|nr:PAS domain-containing sensor histidine kinase [Acidobacteriota bacterium]